MVAHYVAYMPRGGAIGEWLGGTAAISDVVEALRQVEWASVAPHLPKGSKVKPREYPEGIRKQEERDAAKRAQQHRAMRQLREVRRRNRG